MPSKEGVSLDKKTQEKREKRFNEELKKQK